MPDEDDDTDPVADDQNDPVVTFKVRFHKKAKERKQSQERQRDKKKWGNNKGKREKTHEDDSERRIRIDRFPELLTAAEEAIEGLDDGWLPGEAARLKELAGQVAQPDELELYELADLTDGLEEIAAAGWKAKERAEKLLAEVRLLLDRGAGHLWEFNKLCSRWAVPVVGAEVEYRGLLKILSACGPGGEPTALSGLKQSADIFFPCMQAAVGTVNGIDKLDELILWAWDVKPAAGALKALRQALGAWPLVPDDIEKAADDLILARDEHERVRLAVEVLETFHANEFTAAVKKWPEIISDCKMFVKIVGHDALCEEVRKTLDGGVIVLWEDSARVAVKNKMLVVIDRVRVVGTVLTTHAKLVSDLLMGYNALQNLKTGMFGKEENAKNVQGFAVNACTALFGDVVPNEPLFRKEFAAMLKLYGPWQKREKEIAEFNKQEAGIADLKHYLTVGNFDEPEDLAVALYNLNAGCLVVLQNHGVTSDEYDALADFCASEGSASVEACAKMLFTAVTKTSLGELQAVCEALKRIKRTVANLEWHYANSNCQLVYRNPWPWKNKRRGNRQEIQTGAYIELGYAWFPVSKRWAEIHLHYNGTVADQNDVRYAHMKDPVMAVVSDDANIELDVGDDFVLAIAQNQHNKRL